jgi:hypothetical protein
MSFDEPQASSQHRRKVASTGSLSMTITGINFATTGSSQSMRLGFSGAETTEWLNTVTVQCQGSYTVDWGSETELKVKASAGVGGCSRLVVTLGEIAGSFSQGWSIDDHPRA